MATNWELARLKSLVKRDRDITPEDRDFWLKIVDKPGSAVKYSKEIRSILEVLEFRDTSKMTDEAIQAIKDGKAKESAELSTRVNRIANSHKTDTENSFYTTKMSAVKTKIIGQDEVLADIKKKLFVSALLMNNGVNQKPRAFIFAGGSTNGKTAMATKIGEMICDGSLKIQMSNFKSETDVSLITGTSPGYVGATEKSLIETYMESAEGKYCIIFDEIEKAPPKIFRFLIEILDTGYLTLLNGKSLDLRNSIIMFTTNAGVETIGDTIGFQTVEKNVSSN